jgi:hypothetical protein
MTQQEKKDRAFRRQLIRALVATEDIFHSRTVDKDGFAHKERERLKRKKQRKEEARREAARTGIPQ